MKMVRAWYMDDEPSDQRLEHHKTPQEFVTIEKLFQVSGVECFQIPVTDTEPEELAKLRADRGYTYNDELICSRECLENYEEKLKMFFQEHLHTDEEIRYILEGSGYFDVRDRNDLWIRIESTPGDLIVLPKGIYHRFTLDTKNYIKAKRYFIGVPVWTSHSRPSDNMPCRKEYLDKFGQPQITV